MYQAILTRRYLLRKIIPLLAMLSVALCTAMVIIVVSVMTGFLDMVTQAGRKLIGDVAIDRQVTGFPYYEEVLAELRGLDAVAAASPMIEAYGLLKMPYNQISQVQVFGIEADSYDAVTGYASTIYWRPLTGKDTSRRRFPASDLRREDWQADPQDDDLKARLNAAFFDPQYEQFGPLGPAGLRNHTSDWLDPDRPEAPLLERLAQAGRTLRTPGGSPAAVLGMRVSIGNERVASRSYTFQDTWFMPTREVTLTVLPITDDGGVRQPESRILPVANEFVVERYDVDSAYVFVPFAVLQRMLGMHPIQEVSETETDEFGTPLPTGRMIPGRATRLVIKAAPGVTPAQLKDHAAAAWQRVHDRHVGEMPPVSRIQIRTWEEQIALYIGAVQKETALVTTLFAIISLVSVILVLAIFWTVVQQKTRDVGILRAVGASRAGIAWLFLRYGVILGILGVILGSMLAHLIVWNINPIHEWLGEKFGLVIWDPKIYIFDEVPNHVPPQLALVVMAGGVVFAVLGALIPALRAAWIDPVSALRYE